MKRGWTVRVVAQTVALAFALMSAPAEAFYSPVQGWWLSRDPVGEVGDGVVGAKGLRAHSGRAGRGVGRAIPDADRRSDRTYRKTSGADGGVYCFARNAALGLVDPLGRSVLSLDAPSGCRCCCPEVKNGAQCLRLVLIMNHYDAPIPIALWSYAGWHVCGKTWLQVWLTLLRTGEDECTIRQRVRRADGVERERSVVADIACDDWVGPSDPRAVQELLPDWSPPITPVDPPHFKLLSRVEECKLAPAPEVSAP